MAEAVVDVLEAIEVQVQDRCLAMMTPRQHDGIADALTEQDAIGQIGQGVMLGEMGHVARVGAQPADIAKHDHRARHRSEEHTSELQSH